MGKLQSLYLALPHVLKNFSMTLYGFLLKRKRLGEYYCAAYENEKNNHKLSRDELERIQLDKLKDLTLEAYRHSQYYKDAFSENGITEEWLVDCEGRTVEEWIARLPMLSKEALKANIRRLESADARRKPVAITYTSGTTGTPMTVVQDAEANQYTFALWRRFYDWMGLPGHFKNVRFSGRILVRPDQKKPPYWTYNGASGRLFMSTYHMTRENLPYYIQKLNKFRPQLIDGYPSAIVTLAEYLLENHLFLEFVPVAVATTAETLTVDAKQKIEKAFRCSVYNQYASSEGAPFACECREGNMHLWIDTGIFEFVNPVQISEELVQVELVVTSFRSKKTPLIRYQIGDSALIYKKMSDCPCGCTYPVIHSVIGRTDDILYTREKGYVGRLDTAYKGLCHIRESQIIQTSLDTIEIYLVTDLEFTKNVEKKLENNLRERLGERVTYQFIYVDAIPRGANGKFRSVIRKCQIGE